MISAAVAVTVAVAAGASAVAAQAGRNPRDVQPERPTVATHAGTVARGWLEIETGIEVDRVAPSSRTLISPSVLKVGVADRVQLSVFVPLAKPAGASTGIGDVALGVKGRLTEDAPVLGDFALLPIVKFATGSTSSGAGTGTTDLTLLAISSHALGPVAMDLNAGYTRRGGDGTVVPRDATVWTASFGGPVHEHFGWVAEVYGYPATSGPAGQASVVALLGGPTLLVRSWWALDLGVIIPVRGPQPHALYFGTVYNLGQLWRTTARIAGGPARGNQRLF